MSSCARLSSLSTWNSQSGLDVKGPSAWVSRACSKHLPPLGTPPPLAYSVALPRCASGGNGCACPAGTRRAMLPKASE